MAVGKKITDLTASGSLKDTDLAIIHDGNGTKRSTLTQLSEYMGTKFSNPNFLINPDFKINQRSSSTYTTTSESPIYTVDRWMLARGKATVNSDGTVTVTGTGGATNKEGYFQQRLENAISGAYTVSMEVVSISGTVRIAIDGEWKNVTSGKNFFQGVNSSNNFNSVGLQLAVGASITLKWVKLEQGTLATPFVAPNTAEELVKCARFLQVIPEIYFVPYASTRTAFSNNGQYYQSTNGVFPVVMRTDPTITYSDIYNASNDLISENVKSIGSNKYGILFFMFSNNVEYYTVRMKKIIADAEIY